MSHGAKASGRAASREVSMFERSTLSPRKARCSSSHLPRMIALPLTLWLQRYIVR